MNKSYSFLLCCVFAAVVGTTLANPKGACQSLYHIENDDAVTLELSEYAGCTLKFTTVDNRIIAFHHIDGDMSQLVDHVKIHDGADGSVFQSYSKGGKTVYSDGMTAFVEIADRVPSGLRLKVSKAVYCPTTLGPESQCARAVDDVSCYCVTFTQRTWLDSRTFCNNNGFHLVALETREEELAIHSVWGATRWSWTSLNDLEVENVWKWGSTSQPLYPGYANWYPGEPNSSNASSDGGEDCVAMNYAYGTWNDFTCNKLLPAICEHQP